MDVLAVIPVIRPQDAKGFTGRPLWLHAADQARAARQVTRVVAVTADAELTRLVFDSGIEVIEAQAAASANVNALLTAALEGMADRESSVPALAVVLDPTFPLRAAEMIDGAIDLLCESSADSLVSAYPLNDALWVQDELGAVRPCERHPAQRRFVGSGIITAVRIGAFRQSGALPTGRIVLYEVSPPAALRLAEGSDWRDAELLHRRGRAARARKLLTGISLLVLDFDGVMTDNRVLVFEDGREAVLCSRGDGLGLEMLRKAGVPVAVISKEINPVVGARCKKLKIPCLQGIENKLAELTTMVRGRQLQLQQVAYMGNDVNDLECMQTVGVAIAPSDSHPEALRAAHLVTTAPGGFGAVRELCDLLLAARVP